MKAGYFLFAAFSLAAFDDTARELKRSFQEAMEKMPAPDFELSFDEASLGDLEAFYEEALSRAKDRKWTDAEREFAAMLHPKTYQFDGDEAEFHPEILDDPYPFLGLGSPQEIPESQEISQETCVESGEYERQFLQRLEVSILQEMQKAKQCSVHRGTQKVSVKGIKDKKKRKQIADKKIAEIKYALAQDPMVKKGFKVEAAEDVHEYHIDIAVEFQHVDDAPACAHYHLADIPGTQAEKDEWKVDEAEEYAIVQNNPNCKLTLVHVQEGPGTREIDGHPVHRDVWARNLLFRCAPSQNSPCAKLREKGGRLIQKQCVDRDEESGDCRFWKKTYEMGSVSSARTQFPSGPSPIWGMNGELRPDPNPNPNRGAGLSQIFGTLKTIADLPLSDGKNLPGLSSDTALFNGTKHKCRKNHAVHEAYDCCRKMNNFLVCKDKEKTLREMNDEGRCHYVGHYYGSLSKQKKVYCCYPTKLLRIFNEKAREQMFPGKSKEELWGSPKKPKCHGFSLQEMEGKVDFSKIDFSEAASDFPIDEAQIEREMVERLSEAVKKPQLNAFFLEEPDATY